MEEIGRKKLPHELPWSVDMSQETFFVTVCARNRGNGPLLPVAAQLLETIRFRHDNGIWWAHLAVIMPDHVHLLLSFPPEREFRNVMTEWKRWTGRASGVMWQRDFFDHRLRRDESYFEKADYILQNPVRAGLVDEWEKWPHIWVANLQ